MTHEGVKKVLNICYTLYPGMKITNPEKTVAIWEAVLKDYDDAAMAKALEGYIKTDTKGFPPIPGQLIALASAGEEDLGELEAWGMVSRAIRNGNYGAEEEYEKLPEAVKLAVGSPGQIREWAGADIDTIPTVVQSNFLRSYRAAVERRRIARAAPDLLAMARDRAAVEGNATFLTARDANENGP